MEKNEEAFPLPERIFAQPFAVKIPQKVAEKGGF
jgi:hypothetical protein